MNLKKLALAAATGTTLLAAAPAFAHPPHWAPAHGWRAQHHQPRHYHRAPPYVYYQPVRSTSRRLSFIPRRSTTLLRGPRSTARSPSGTHGYASAFSSDPVHCVRLRAFLRLIGNN